MPAKASSRSGHLVFALAVIVLFAVRLPFLPPTLEDIDSVNFDLGVHDFDPVLHRPHPPGYILFIAAAKLAHPLFASHAQGLAFVSAVFGAATVMPLAILMRLLLGATAGWLATVFVLFAPVVWFNGVRPMSDTMGLFAVLSALALMMTGLERREEDQGRPDRLWTLGALVAGLSLGIRVQAVMLVGPLLGYGFLRQPRLRWRMLACFGLGVAAWLIPLLVLSEGPGLLWRTFQDMVRNAAPTESLVSAPTLHRLSWAVHDSFLGPWGPLWFGLPVVTAALAGLVILAWSDRRRLFLLALLFLPYATYHLLLQWTDTLRYALPIVPATAALAAVPFARWRTTLGVPVGVVAAAYVAASLVVTGPALLIYGEMPSPPARALAYLAELGTDTGTHPIVGGHFVYFRHLPQLPSSVKVIHPVEHVEWRQFAEYWRDGGRRPAYFLRDEIRTSLQLIDPDSQQAVQRWEWAELVDRLVKGARPTRIDLIRIDPPRWFAYSGFLLTHEAGPTAVVEREPHRLYVRTERFERRLSVSGEVPGGATTEVGVAVDGTEAGRWPVSGPFTIDATLGPFESEGQYAHVAFTAPVPLRLRHVWLGRAAGASVQPAAGFHMPERDEEGLLFRWIGPEASSIVLLPPEATGVRLRLRGQLPADYYELPVRIGFVVDGREVASHEVRTNHFDFEEEIPFDGREGLVRLVTEQHFVPDDIEHNGDRRPLAFRVYEMSAEPIVADVAADGTDDAPGGNSLTR